LRKKIKDVLSVVLRRTTAKKNGRGTCKKKRNAHTKRGKGSASKRKESLNILGTGVYANWAFLPSECSKDKTSPPSGEEGADSSYGEGKERRYAEFGRNLKKKSYLRK